MVPKPGLDLRAAASPGAAALGRAPSEIRPEILPGVARLARSDVFGGAGGDDVAAGVAALGTEINDPVGGFDDFEVVLDDQHRVTGFDECVQYVEEFSHIVEMQPCRWLVEDVEGAAGSAARQFLR